jgi:pimeloyl-ACP methyl ester carboxylesterase
MKLAFLRSVVLLTANAAMAAEPIKLQTPTGTIYGTIEIPAGAGPFPIALIHAGSGPTDRDGNSSAVPGKNNSLKMLAEALATRGIASLRFDKRGVAESIRAAPREEDLRFETYIEDLVAWGRQIRADKRFSRLVIAGHSEGALIGAVAAAKLLADAFISIAGAGQSAGDVIIGQMSERAPADLQRRVKEIVDSLNRGKPAPDVPQGLPALFRPSVQPYLISWFKYDPAKEIAKLSMPVLLVQGTTDVQVSEKDARLLAAAKPAARLAIIPGMNHVLKSVPADPAKQMASYGDPELPVAAILIDEIARFIRER